MLRRLRYPLFLVVAFLVLFEGALQVTACTLWAIQPDLAGVEGDRPVVLCIGDSFTHGMGATRHELAYPGQLETALDGRATVVNGGMVAQSSADVLKRLQGQIDRFHPAVVCVLCGINDLGWPTTRVPRHDPD